MATALPDPVIEPSDDHEPGAPVYVIVWLALVVLATVTLLVSRTVTGGFGLVVAFAIATSKAVLVVAYFMHLASGKPIYRIVFSIAMAFLILLVIGVLADVATRSIASSYVDELGRPL
jgi:caa(3)-type oxidase subunit IV